MKDALFIHLNVNFVVKWIEQTVIKILLFPTVDYFCLVMLVILPRLLTISQGLTLYIWKQHKCNVTRNNDSGWCL
jgi:hypothetical protein